MKVSWTSASTSKVTWTQLASTVSPTTRKKHTRLLAQTAGCFRYRHTRLTQPLSGYIRIDRARRVTHRPTESRRSLFTDSLPSALVPPVVFTGLLLTLWAYKCIMTVLFQDKIIYMPYMPPFARSEKIEDYASICKPVAWEQKSISSLDGTRIEICIGKLQQQQVSCDTNEPHKKEIILCYFHGNGSSVPPRLVLLSGVLKAIETHHSLSSVKYTLVALSYRGYWKSAGRASQAGIELDAQALLRWISTEYATTESELILWGQSIGAGVASTAAATYLSTSRSPTETLPIAGVILETPFTSIKSMLLTLYPQRWLPYRYLWPFLWNHWDAERALRMIAQTKKACPILLVPATRDEVVPPEEVNKLEDICNELKLPVQRRNVIGALHTDATIRRDGQDIIAKFVVDRVEDRREHMS